MFLILVFLVLLGRTIDYHKAHPSFPIWGWGVAVQGPSKEALGKAIN